MKNINTIKVNFKGGVIPPGDFYNLLVAAGKSGLGYVRFGLRQQILFDVEIEDLNTFRSELDLLGLAYELNKDEFPNILSSCPAEDIFISNSWITENVYQEVFRAIDYQPRLKINISDLNQGFTPLLTGNINWVGAPAEPNFWHLFIRFPKTNVVYEWKDLLPTSELGQMSRHIEEIILQDRNRFYDNNEASGEELYAKVNHSLFHAQPAPNPLILPPFNLPYYEGLNRHNDQYWLGIYRRDELFGLKFLKEICQLCLHTQVRQVCSTPWKTIIIKGIEDQFRKDWINLLNKFQINVRHASNELNFQVEDNNLAALKLKQQLVKYLNDDDTRTFGVCIGLKTRKKTEVFCSILVRRKALINIGRWSFIHSYDILCAKDFNPNERTALVFSRDNPRILLGEQLRRAILSFYKDPAAEEPTQYEVVDDPNAESVDE